jgi:serine/threonine-protein kinase RsbW
MKRKFEFASHPANLKLLRTCVRQFLQDSEFSAREIELMILGVDEACTNIIRHAYHLKEDQLICVTLESCLAGGVRFRLRDYGDRCEPEELCGRPLECVRPGGLGLHLIRYAFDQINYLQKRKGTLLILTKLREKSAEFAPRADARGEFCPT